VAGFPAGRSLLRLSGALLEGLLPIPVLTEIELKNR